MSRQRQQTETQTSEVQTIETPIKQVPKPLEDFTDNALHNILPARYLVRDNDGNVIEEPDDLFERVAENVARAEIDHAGEDANERFEKWADEFQHLMETQQFMPNSPTLMNAGTELQQLSACFVLEPDDDMDNIFDSARHAALIFKSGGGVGYSFSDLRPQGTIVESTGGESSGPISFMEVFNSTCNTVQQGGKRRGAQMAILRVDHADVGRFACAKRTEGDFDNFNISVAATDEFVAAVNDDEQYTFYDPETDYDEPFEVVEATRNFFSPEFETNPKDWEQADEEGYSGKLVKENLWRDYADTIEAWDPAAEEKVPLADKWKDDDRIDLEEGETMTLPGRFIMDILVDGAWRNGEPGIFYHTETNRKHSFDTEKYPEHKVNATNPCAEQPLSEFEACNLGHINLSLMLKADAEPFGEWERKQEGITFTDVESKVEMYLAENLDYDQLDHVIESGTRFLDNVVTQSEFPLDEISERVKGQRKIGLGIMGFAQMLFQMGVPYGSKKSYEVAQQVMKRINHRSKLASHDLAKDRGSFDYWDESKYADPTEYPEWFENHVYEDPEEFEDGFAIRNHNTTTIAPTGTTSMLGNTTGGCEPLYNVVNYKNVGDDVQGDDMLVEVDDYFEQTLEENGYDTEEVIEDAKDLMANDEFDGPHDLDIPDRLADIFVTTQDLSSRQHTEIQRAFQEHIDSGISKTINMSNDATRDDVYKAYMLALDRGEHTLGDPIKGMTVYRDGSRDEQVLTTRRDNGLDEETDDEGVLREAMLTLLEQGQDDIAKAIGAAIRGDEGVDEDTYCPECGTKIKDEDETESCYICPNEDCFYSPCS